MKQYILKLLAFIFIMSLSAESIFAKGACWYKRTSLAKYACTIVPSKKRCDLLGVGETKFYSGKTCEDIEKKNSSTASILIENFPGIIDEAFRNYYAYGSASISAIDTFSKGTSLDGTHISLYGTSEFIFIRTSSKSLYIYSLSAKLYPLQLTKKMLPLHLYFVADELFALLEIQDFSFSGELVKVDEGYQLSLTQFKTIHLKNSDLYGNIKSSSSAFIPEDTSEFTLISEGVTYHPSLLRPEESI